MSIDLLMITTSQYEKQNCLKNTIFSLIDKIHFNKKLIGIDIVENEKISEQTLNLLKNLNFSVDAHPCRGMVQNILSVVNDLESDWVLYCEDDVYLRDFPDFDLLVNFLDSKYGKSVGIIDLYFGCGIGPWEPRELEYKKNFMDENYHFSFQDFQLFERSRESFDGVYINFPIIIMRKELFYMCLVFCLKECKGLQIEFAMSKAYHSLGFNNLFKKIHVFNKMKIDILSCKNLSSYEIVRNKLMAQHLLVETKESNPENKKLAFSAFHENHWGSIHYSF